MTQQVDLQFNQSFTQYAMANSRLLQEYFEDNHDLEKQGVDAYLEDLTPFCLAIGIQVDMQKNKTPAKDDILLVIHRKVNFYIKEMSLSGYPREVKNKLGSLSSYWTAAILPEVNKQLALLEVKSWY